MAVLSLAQLGVLPQSWPSLTTPSLSQVASSRLPSLPSGPLQKGKAILLLFLSAIKNPPTVFTQQANIAHGHQQVNNDNLSASHARENQKQQNELLRDSNEAMDSRRATTAIATDQELATVETFDRRKKPTR